MDIQAYIQSGIIESYVLGLASAEEIAEIEVLRLQYPEIDNAIESFSVMLEQTAFENAIAPPAEVKLKIMDALARENEEFQDDTIIPVSPLSPNVEGNSAVRIIFFRRWRMVAAASVILLISSVALNIYFYSKYKQQNKAYITLLSERNTLQANNQVFQTRLQNWQSAAAMMADPEMAIIKMPDVSGQAGNLATVFWNTKTRDVYVMLNKLAQPSIGKQYQLWALVDGKPVDAGMLDLTCNGVCKMKTIPKAEAFAITLERQGGSPTPTMEAMVVLGKV